LSRCRFGLDTQASQLAGETLAPLLKIGRPRREPLPIGPDSPHSHMDVWVLRIVVTGH
jgi:hypothetical protein